MRQVVQQIAHQAARENRRAVDAEQPTQDQKNGRADRRTDDRWNEPPAVVLGECVVHPVDHVGVEHSDATVRRVVKREAVNQIFEERPAEQPDGEELGRQQRSQARGDSAPDEERRGRHVKNDERGRMNVRKPLEKILIEHPRPSRLRPRPVVHREPDRLDDRNAAGRKTLRRIRPRGAFSG